MTLSPRIVSTVAFGFCFNCFYRVVFHLIKFPRSGLGSEDPTTKSGVPGPNAGAAWRKPVRVNLDYQAPLLEAGLSLAACHGMGHLAVPARSKGHLLGNKL